MQLVKLKRRLSDAKAMLDRLDGDCQIVTMTVAVYEQLTKNIAEAIDAADKIGYGHHAIAETLNRI